MRRPNSSQRRIESNGQFIKGFGFALLESMTIEERKRCALVRRYFLKKNKKQNKKTTRHNTLIKFTFNRFICNEMTNLFVLVFFATPKLLLSTRLLESGTSRPPASIDSRLDRARWLRPAQCSGSATKSPQGQSIYAKSIPKCSTFKSHWKSW